MKDKFIRVTQDKDFEILIRLDTIARIETAVGEAAKRVKTVIFLDGAQFYNGKEPLNCLGVNETVGEIYNQIQN